MRAHHYTIAPALMCNQYETERLPSVWSPRSRWLCCALGVCALLLPCRARLWIYDGSAFGGEVLAQRRQRAYVLCRGVVQRNRRMPKTKWSTGKSASVPCAYETKNPNTPWRLAASAFARFLDLATHSLSGRFVDFKTYDSCCHEHKTPYPMIRAPMALVFDFASWRSL
jgi:hypothetical protein